MQPRAVGLAWFREEDYPALLKIFDDSHKMPRTWKEWLKVAEQMEQRAKAAAQHTERVYIDPDTVPVWCRRVCVDVDRDGRSRFVVETLAAKSGNQR